MKKDVDAGIRLDGCGGHRWEAEAQTILGDICRRGIGVATRLRFARGWYSVAAKQGNASAQYALGDIYLLGTWVFAVIIRLAPIGTKRLPEQGDMRARAARASIYLSRPRQTGRSRRSRRLFVQAADQGDARALHQAALMHLNGDGLPENIDKAETYLRKLQRKLSSRDHQSWRALYAR